jgi:tRNA A37 threonylcarbamoyladenosine dehydratase
MTHASPGTPCRGHLFHRTAMLVGKPAMERLGALRVAVFGVGGVGSWTAEALVRSGVECLTLVDSDVVCATNVNRQLQATTANVGQPKVEELKKRLLEINPHARIEARQKVYNERSADQFDLRTFDYVIDAIDSLCNKVLLIQRCKEAGVTIYASMGAGAKLDPTQIKVAKLADTCMCPLARMVRKRLGRRGIPADFLCVYSEEPPRDPATETLCGTGQCACSHTHPKTAEADAENPDWCARKTRVHGTAVHITAVFGFMLAGLVMQDVVARVKSGNVQPPTSNAQHPTGKVAPT